MSISRAKGLTKLQLVYVFVMPCGLKMTVSVETWRHA